VDKKTLKTIKSHVTLARFGRIFLNFYNVKARGFLYKLRKPKQTSVSSIFLIYRRLARARARKSDFVDNNIASHG